MRTLQIGLTAALLLCLAAGCARNPNAPAKISGRVMYKGNPVPGGTITLHSEGKGSYSRELAEDGTYEFADIPTGTLTVTVDTEQLNPKKKAPDYGGAIGNKMYAERVAAEQKMGRNIAPKGQSQGNYVKIPLKYSSSKTSPLTVDIQSGRQVKEFELSD
jgi:hypothetical protein